MKLTVVLKTRLISSALAMLASVVSIAGLVAMEESAEPFGFPGDAGASVGAVAGRARRTANPYLPGAESVRHAKTAEPTGTGTSPQLSVPAEQPMQVPPVIQGLKTLEAERFATIMKNITSKNMPHDVVRDGIISQLSNDDKVKLVSAALGRVPKEHRNALLKISSQDYNAMINALSDYASSIADNAVRERVLDYMKIKMAVTDYFVKHTVRPGRLIKFPPGVPILNKESLSQTMLDEYKKVSRSIPLRVNSLQFDPNNSSILYGIAYQNMPDERQPSYIFALDFTQFRPKFRIPYVYNPTAKWNKIADLKMLSSDKLVFIYRNKKLLPRFLEKKENLWKPTDRVSVDNAQDGTVWLEVSSDGNILAVNLDSRLSLMDRNGNSLEIEGGVPVFWHWEKARAAFSPDNKYLAVTTEAGLITILNIATGQRFSRSYDKQRYIVDLAYNPATGDLIVLYNNGLVEVCDADTLKIKSSFKTKFFFNRVSTMAISPDGKIIAINSRSEVNLFNATTGDLLHTLSAPARTRSLAFSRDNRRLATGLDGGGVMIWDAPVVGW